MLSVPDGGLFHVDELAREIEATRSRGAAFWSQFDRERFFAPLGEAWSPADNVRHLIRSNRPVAKALRIPRFVLRLRFGRSERPSRGFVELRDDYRKALGGGLQAGSFAPPPLAPERQTEEERRRILARWSDSLVELRGALERWPEEALERLRLPHPGLGLLTVREMLLFTIYHNQHHALGVDRRRAAR